MESNEQYGILIKNYGITTVVQLPTLRPVLMKEYDDKRKDLDGLGLYTMDKSTWKMQYVWMHACMHGWMDVCMYVGRWVGG